MKKPGVPFKRKAKSRNFQSSTYGDKDILGGQEVQAEAKAIGSSMSLSTLSNVGTTKLYGENARRKKEKNKIPIENKENARYQPKPVQRGLEGHQSGKGTMPGQLGKSRRCKL